MLMEHNEKKKILCHRVHLSFGGHSHLSALPIGPHEKIIFFYICPHRKKSPNNISMKMQACIYMIISNMLKKKEKRGSRAKLNFPELIKIISNIFTYEPMGMAKRKYSD